MTRERGSSMNDGVRSKGSIIQVNVVKMKMSDYGVSTEWAVEIWFQSPTGDSSDSLTRHLPCTSLNQAIWIADDYNKTYAPQVVGAWDFLLTPAPLEFCN